MCSPLSHTSHSQRQVSGSWGGAKDNVMKKRLHGIYLLVATQIGWEKVLLLCICIHMKKLHDSKEEHTLFHNLIVDIHIYTGAKHLISL